MAAYSRGMGTAAGEAKPRRPEPSSAARTDLQATRAVNSSLRELRAASPQKARAVQELIDSIPDIPSEPVRIEVPGAPKNREYLAAFPYERDAPVVIYRHLQPDDHAEGDWLVTALIDRNEYEEYRHAELRGIVDNPAVRHIAGGLVGTVATILNADPGGTRQGSATDEATR